MRHDSFHICEMISDVWNDFRCVKLFHTWVVWDTILYTYVKWFQMCEMISNVWNYFTYESHETRLISHMGHDVSISGTRLGHTQGTTHFYVFSATQLILMWRLMLTDFTYESTWVLSRKMIPVTGHDLLIRKTRLIFICVLRHNSFLCDMTHVDSFHIWVNMSHVTQEWVVSHNTYRIESCLAYEWVMSHI